MAGQDVERERGDFAPRIERLLVQDHAVAEQRIGVRRAESCNRRSRDNRR